MLPGDRLVCAFVQPQTVGTQFRSWLLHVTIVPWFRLHDGSEQIADGLSRALVPVVPFETGIEGETRLGPRKRRAHLLQPGSFPDIEQRVRGYLHKKRAWLVDETTRKPHKFLPHVTFQDAEHLADEAVIICDRVYLVEQKGAVKEVVASIELGAMS